jgi:hypothetical protein
MSDPGSPGASHSAEQGQSTQQGTSSESGSTETRSVPIPERITGNVVIETAKGGEVSDD